MIDYSAEPTRRVAGDPGIEDWLWVEEAARRRHRILFVQYSQVSDVEYEALREWVEVDLAGQPR
jgi:hypothetical protein